MKKITYLAAAIAFLGFTSLDANAQTDKSKKKSKKKQAVEQTETQQETQTETTETVADTQVNYQEAAQGQTQTQGQSQSQGQTGAQGQNEKREAITQEELPEPVKQTLTAATFSAWQIVEVYRITPNANAQGANAQGSTNQAEQATQNAQSQNAQINAQGQGPKTVYEILFTNEQQQSAKVRIDEQGNIVRDQK